MKSTNPTLSVCMIVKNEEGNLPRLLGSIRGLADEVIIVDTGSTDRTVEIAREYGASVHFFDWCDDFSAARNESLSHATKDYILWLDADDEVKKEEHARILEHLRKYPGRASYLSVSSIHPNEVGQASQIRIFPNHRGIVFTGRVHEQSFFSIQEKNIPFAQCEATIIHHGYEEEQEQQEKLLRNIKIHEQEIAEEPDNAIPYFFLARGLKGIGLLDQALENYRIFIDRAEQEQSLKSASSGRMTRRSMST